MLKILSGKDLPTFDRLHRERYGLSQLEVMERVAQCFVDWYRSKGFLKDLPLAIACGAGNNGGDGLAIARLLHQSGYRVEVLLCFSKEDRLSECCSRNLSALPTDLPWETIHSNLLSRYEVLVDAFLGVGFQGELREQARKVIQILQSFAGKVISLDLPSGLPSDTLGLDTAVEADVTVTLGFPKLSLLLPEHAACIGELQVLDIGMDPQDFAPFPALAYYLEGKDLKERHRVFHGFTHKGDRGKVLLLAGSKGRMGAAILAAKSAFRSGAGTVTVWIPEEERGIVQAALPEAMCVFGEEVEWTSYTALGIGPGMGLGKSDVFSTLLRLSTKPLVLDADALTLLSLDKKNWSLLPKGSILTPHVKEFDRLFGPSATQLERMAKAKDCCLCYGINVLLKGAHSLCSLADGRQVFNSSGTKYMATAGMGDALTGIVTSFLGQGYSPENALLCGVFHHGLAGELAGQQYLRGTMARDVIEAIPATFRRIGLD